MLLIAAMLAWAIKLPAVNLDNMTDIGLLSVLSPWFYAALALLTLSFCLIVFIQPRLTSLLFLHILGFIFIIHGTPAILYGTLRYAWAWKHVGMVDYIQRHGSIDPNIPFLDAYHNWPGFFALNTLLTQASGLSSSLVYAQWAPVFFNLFFCGGAYIIFRSLTTNRSLVWMAVWFLQLGNWVGQDYFAPQAYAFFSYLVCVGILLRYFSIPDIFHPGEIIRWTRPDRKISFVTRLINQAVNTRPHTLIPPNQRVVLMAIAILLMIAITFSHQLTPILLISALIFLVIVRQIYPAGLPVLASICVLTWMWFLAAPFVGRSFLAIVDSVGTIGSNMSDNFINLAQASSGQVVVAVMGRALTFFVGLLGAIGFFWRWYKGNVDLAPVALIMATLPILVGNSYGGEVLFRIYLFALPFLAFFISALFEPAIPDQILPLRMCTMLAISLMMIVGLLFSYYGKEKQYYFSPGEIEATQYLFNTAPPGALIIEGTRNYPSLFRNYEFYTYVAIESEPGESLEGIIESPASVMVRWMENSRYSGAYLIVTRSMKAEIEMVGTMPPGSLEKIEASLVQSGKFRILYQNEDATIYVLRNE